MAYSDEKSEKASGVHMNPARQVAMVAMLPCMHSAQIIFDTEDALSQVRECTNEQNPCTISVVAYHAT